MASWSRPENLFALLRQPVSSAFMFLPSRKRPIVPTKRTCYLLTTEKSYGEAEFMQMLIQGPHQFHYKMTRHIKNKYYLANVVPNVQILGTGNQSNQIEYDFGEPMDDSDVKLSVTKKFQHYNIELCNCFVA